MLVDQQAAVLDLQEALLPLRLVLEADQELGRDEGAELALLVLLDGRFCPLERVAHYLHFPVALPPLLALDLLAPALLHLLGLGGLDGDYFRALEGGLLGEEPGVGLLDLLADHKHVDGGEQPPVGLVGDPLAVDLEYPIEQLLEVVPPGLLAVDDLELGGELGQVEVDVLEVHANDLVERLEVAVPLHAPHH